MQGIALTEDTQYDEIFTALKHPIRRQILLFIDSKGETSFTEIQQETGITDTGLMSYHLKGLSSLIEQSKRGKYQLSEVGRAGVELFRKVDHEREHTNKVIHEEIEHFVGLSIKKSILFLLIAGLTLSAPLMVDIYFNTNIVLSQGYTTMELVGVFWVTIALMVLGVFLFAMYDRYYYAKTTKNSLIHSLLFTLGGSAFSILNFNMMRNFTIDTIMSSQVQANEIPWLFEILRITVFITSAPVFAYLLGRFAGAKDKTGKLA
jgi:hypothetical protein